MTERHKSIASPEIKQASLEKKWRGTRNCFKSDKIWYIFKCGLILDYTQLYNKDGVLILPDVLENLKAKCLQSYGVDSSWYYTLPSMSLSAMTGENINC